MPEPLLCLCTCPDDASAARIADALVGERLAACVNTVPGMRSTYRWQGAVEHADEHQLLIKTSRSRFDALRARIQALHPHAVPELIAIDIADGRPAYLDWIAAETSPGGG